MLVVIFCVLFVLAWIGALLLAMGRAIEDDGPGTEYAKHDATYIEEVMRTAREEGGENFANERERILK